MPVFKNKTALYKKLLKVIQDIKSCSDVTEEEKKTLSDLEEKVVMFLYRNGSLFEEEERGDNLSPEKENVAIATDNVSFADTNVPSTGRNSFFNKGAFVSDKKENTTENNDGSLDSSFDDSLLVRETTPFRDIAPRETTNSMRETIPSGDTAQTAATDISAASAPATDDNMISSEGGKNNISFLAREIQKDTIPDKADKDKDMSSHEGTKSKGHGFFKMNQMFIKGNREEEAATEEDTEAEDNIPIPEVHFKNVSKEAEEEKEDSGSDMKDNSSITKGDSSSITHIDSSSLTSKDEKDDDKDEAESKDNGSNEEDVNTVSLTEDNAVDDVALATDSVEEVKPTLSDIDIPVASYDDKLSPQPDTSLPDNFTVLGEDGLPIPEEYEKPLKEFVYQRSVINLIDPNTRETDQAICTIYPFEPYLTEDRNTKILVIVEYEGEFYEASSYENESEGSNMVRIEFGSHELLFQGSIRENEFSSSILPIGITADKGEKVEEIDKELNNPPHRTIKNGHLKFTYDAAADMKGIVEIFWIRLQNNHKKLFLVRRADEFVDYAFPEDQPFVIRTMEDDRVVAVKATMEKVTAELKPFSY